MNNSEAYRFLCEHIDVSTRMLTDQFISIYGFESDQFNHFRLKFTNLVKERRCFFKKEKRSDLETWDTMSFSPLPKRAKIDETPSRVY